MEIPKDVEWFLEWSYECREEQGAQKYILDLEAHNAKLERVVKEVKILPLYLRAYFRVQAALKELED